MWEAGGAAGSRWPNYPGSGAPLLPLASWSPTPGRWGWGKRSLPGSSGGWLHQSSSAFPFLSPSLHVRSSGPLSTIPPLQTQRASFPLHPAPRRYSPSACPASLPVEPLLLPRAPPQTPPPPEGRHPQVCQAYQGALGEHRPLPHPMIQRQTVVFFSFLVLNTETVKVCLVLSS